MGNLAWDPDLTAREQAAAEKPSRPFRIGGGLQDIPGGVPKEEHELEENNVERLENKKMMKRRMNGVFYKYPEVLYKTGGLTREVKNDDDFEDAIAKGWMTAKQLHDGEVEELQTEDPDRINHMTVKQALAFIKEHRQDAAKLVQMRADEQQGGNRKAVLDALAEAEDAFGFAGMNVKNAKPVAATKKPGRPRKQ